MSGFGFGNFSSAEFRVKVCLGGQALYSLLCWYFLSDVDKD